MHNFIKRGVMSVLTLALFFGLAAISAAAATYTGDTLIAINTNFSTASKSEGGFTVQSDLEQVQASRSVGEGGEKIFKTYRDPDSGKRLRVVTPDLPELKPSADEGLMTADWTLPEAMLSEHGESDVFSLTTLDKSKMDMVCLYVGTYCTVWGTTSDNAVIQLTAEQATEIGEQFDLFFPDVTNAFGSYWYDADEDGRVAIMCYDIDHDYGTTVGTYTAGYFYSVDMLGFDKRLNGIRFNNTPTNAMDCIHVDTYPLMGYGAPMDRIEDCFATLVHEFQHMLNFSSLIENGKTMNPIMPTYLNEAFSMAAEHMICGASSTANRVSYFSGSSYTAGTALTYWSNNLSSYANSYLFGQYIRTRYGALNGDDGSTIFKTVIETRQTQPSADCLTLIANLLGTTQMELIADFWCACYLKEDSGNHGFGGERWAEAISPHVANSFTSTSAIYNGGAKYYRLESDFTPASSYNIMFISPDDPEVELPTEAPVLVDLSAERLSSSEAKITFTPDLSGSLYYALTSRVITDKSQISKKLDITANSHTTLRINALKPSQRPTFYFYTEAYGIQSPLQSIQIPAAAFHYAVIQPNEAEFYIPTQNIGTVYFTLYDAYSGRMLEVFDFALTGEDLYRTVRTEHNLYDCTVKIFQVDENGAPMSAAITP